MSAVLTNLVLVLGLMLGMWLVSLRKRDVSIVDAFWPLLFLLVATHSVWVGGMSPAKAWLLGPLTLWSLRLAAHLFVRNHGQPEDPRYAAFRARYGHARYRWVSLFQVFLLQGALAFAISAPLQLALLGPVREGIQVQHVVGAALALLGITIESVSDWQLTRFRADPSRRGTVLDRGLWRYSRHPNYFGEAVAWWGFWVASISLDDWRSLAAILSPIAMTYLLLRVSGVTLLDAQLVTSKPGYRDYIERTSAFIPRPPRPRAPQQTP